MSYRYVSATLAGPPRVAALKEVASICRIGAMEAKLRWGNAIPILSVEMSGDVEFLDSAKALDDLVKWCAREGVEMTFYTTADDPVADPSALNGREIGKDFILSTVRDAARDLRKSGMYVPR